MDRRNISGGARYYRKTINHVCGHSQEHHIPLGVLGYSEPKASDKCTTCAAAERNFKALNCPEWLTYNPMYIKGTDKQVAWAKDIRKRIQSEATVLLAKLRQGVDAGEIKAGDAVHFCGPVFMVLGTLLTSFNAREIIDLREYDPIIQAGFHLDRWNVQVEGINK